MRTPPKILNTFSLGLMRFSLITLLFSGFNAALRQYETVVDSYLSFAMENTLGIFSTFGLITGMVMFMVWLLIKELND